MVGCLLPSQVPSTKLGYCLKINNDQVYDSISRSDEEKILGANQLNVNYTALHSNSTCTYGKYVQIFFYLCCIFEIIVNVEQRMDHFLNIIKLVKFFMQAKDFYDTHTNFE